ncbi:MAG TPA: O-methyltransferase [Mycobacteriales bacterium]|nr:O-methyltransferase [Mycobacteriales bacterium]
MAMESTAADVAGWVEGWLPEEPAVLAARARAAEVGVGAVDTTTGALLRVLAASCRARAVVELGTGAGVSALWLLGGMQRDGVLTSVDPDTEHQRLARQSLVEAGYGTGRVRLITGQALAVLPRLSDGAYDLLLCDAARAENADYLTAGLRLLRPGGLVVFAGALGDGRVADPAARDPETVALRELSRLVRDHERLTPSMLPVGSGLLVAAVS